MPTSSLSAFSKRLATQSLIYIVGNVTARMLPFLLIPLYTKYLSTGNYGLIEIIRSVSFVLRVVLLLGLDGALSRLYYEYTDEGTRTRLVSSIFTFLVTLSMGAAILLTLVFSQFDFVYDGLSFWEYGTPVIWAVALGSPYYFLLAYLRAVQKPHLYVSLDLAWWVATALFSYVTIAGLNFSVIGKLWGDVAASLLLSIVAVRYFAKHGSFGTIAWHYVSAALVFGLPLVPHLLMNWVVNLSDRIVIQHYLGWEQVGIYSVGYNIGYIVQMVAIAVNLAWAPLLFESRQNQGHESQTHFLYIANFYWLALILLATTFTFLARPLITLVASSVYLEAEELVRIVAFGCLFFAAYTLFSNALYQFKQTKYLPVITLVSAVVNFGLNMTLVPIYGILASAWITLGTFFVLAMGNYLVARRIPGNIAYPWWRWLLLWLLSYTIVTLLQPRAINLMATLTGLLIAYILILLSGLLTRTITVESVMKLQQNLRSATVRGHR